MTWVRGAAIAATLLVSAPVSAETFATPAQNLDCAAWAALIGGQAETADDATGAATMLAWYIGLYEGTTGTSIDDALTARLQSLKQEEMATLNSSCAARSVAFGNRLVSLGKRMSALED